LALSDYLYVEDDLGKYKLFKDEKHGGLTVVGFNYMLFDGSLSTYQGKTGRLWIYCLPDAATIK